MARLSLTLLGGFLARLEPGEPLSLPTRKAQALLAYLALPPGQAHRRDKVAALLWGDMGEAQARGSLRQALVALRKALPPGVLLTDGETVALDSAGVDVDVAAFEGRVAEGTPGALAEAAGSYKGDLLAGVVLREAAFEEWLLGERERLRELALETLAKLLAHQRGAGQTEGALQTGLRLLTLDPLQEPVHRTLMRLYVQLGRRGAALRQYQQCVVVLQRELGVEPEAETKQLYQEILRQRASHRSVEVVAEEPHPTVLPGAPSAETQLVGREAEVRRLREALEAGRSGHGGLVVVLGEAGIGKSRLVAEVVAEAARRGTRVLVGRSYESQQILAFGPWVDAFRGGLVASGGVVEDLAPAWRSELARLLPELGPPPTPVTDFLPLFEAVAQWVGQLAARRPLLLILEDLHWADEMSLRLLAFLGRRLVSWRALVVVTVREEELPDAPAVRRAVEELARDRLPVTLTVGPISEAETLALVRTLARSGTEETELARLGGQVWAASQGNPLVVVETMRAVREGATAETSLALALPDRVREVITRRLERLGERDQRLAEVAAVIGREFEFALLQRASGLAEAAAAASVEELVRRRLLHGVGERFDFTHDRVREVVQRQVLPPRRKLLHRRVAEALEEVYAANLEPHYVDLALHYRGAEVSEKAVEYLTRFAETAARGHAHAEAIRALQEALSRAEGLPAGGERDRRLVDLVLRQVPSLNFLGRFQESLNLLLAQQERAERCQDPAIAGPYYFWLGRTYSVIGDHERSVPSARRAVEEARRCEDRTTLGRACYILALESFWLGEFSHGVEHGQEAVTLLEPTGDRWWLGVAHFIVGVHRALQGDFEHALESEARAAAIGDAIRDPRLRSCASWATGFMRALTGDWEAAIGACTGALEHSRDPVNTACALAFLGYAYLEKADPVEALRRLEESVGLLETIRDRRLLGWVTAWVAEAWLQHGQIELARDHAMRATQITTETRFRYAAADARRTLGRVARVGGDVREGRRHLDEALQAFSSMRAPLEVARTHLYLAELGHVGGDPTGSAAHVAEAYRLFGALRVPTYVERAAELARRLGLPITTAPPR